MKRIFHTLLLCASCTVLVSSCTKVVNIDLNEASPQYVIEGTITDGSGPYSVRISKTVNFSADNVYPSVKNAFVVISDNQGVTDTLTEVSPGLYQTHKITGAPGRTYKLRVRTDGRQFQAETTMPLKVALDSIRFSAFNGPGGNKRYTTLPIFLDPPQTGNAYRFVLSVDGKVGKSYIVYNDAVSNGTVNQRPLFDNELDVKKGSDVSLEMRCIDQPSYDYYYTLDRVSGGGPGGGTTPTNPPNNITGDKALGLFEAYTTQTVNAKVE